MAITDPTMIALRSAVSGANADLLAALLDGPNAAVAVAALGHILVGDDNATPADIVTAMQPGDATLPLRILQAQQSSLTRLGGADPVLPTGPIGGGKMQMDVDSAAAARQRQVESQDWTNQILAYAVTGGFFGLIVLLIALPQWIGDGTTKDLLFTLLGVVATGWANIIGYYFGSSAGSKQKSATISAALDQSIQNNPPG
jgi:hypothetical protein